jgi:hypothetical protein
MENRAAKVREERRRKPGSVTASGLKLAVDESKMDRNTFAYHWASDKGNRIAQMKDNDWDVVNEEVKADADGLGTVQNKVVGTDAGKPIQGVLMRKRKDWFDADKKEAQKPLDETDEAIRRGLNHTKESPELAGSSYTPGGRNTVNRT